MSRVLIAWSNWASAVTGGQDDRRVLGHHLSDGDRLLVEDIDLAAVEVQCAHTAAADEQPKGQAAAYAALCSGSGESRPAIIGGHARRSSRCVPRATRSDTAPGRVQTAGRPTRPDLVGGSPCGHVVALDQRDAAPACAGHDVHRIADDLPQRGFGVRLVLQLDGQIAEYPAKFALGGRRGATR